MNTQIDITSFKQLKVPDYYELSHILMVAKGLNRNMEQFAKDCGVSPATFTRIIYTDEQKAFCVLLSHKAVKTIKKQELLAL